MRTHRSFFTSFAIIVLLCVALIIFVVPYNATTTETPLDRVLPIAAPATYTFADTSSSEQWQLEPVPSILAVWYVPSKIYLAANITANQRLFMITRRVYTDTQTADTREFYARTDQGDFLMGRVTAGQIIAYAPRLLVRPQTSQLTSWNHYFTDGQGTINATQTPTTTDCRRIELVGRDVVGWHETLCTTYIASQNHESTNPATVRTSTPKLQTRTILEVPASPKVAQLGAARLTRLGAMQPHNNNEKVISSLVPIPDQGIVVGSVTSGYVVAMRIADGSEAWTYRVDGDVYGEPVRDPYFGDMVVASTAKEIHVIDEHGMRRWSAKQSDAIVADPCPTPAGVAVADTAGNVSLRDGMDGHLLWSVSIGGNVVATPVYATQASLIIVGTQSGGLVALSLQGEIVWQSDNHEAVLADLRIHNDVLYTIGNKGSLAAFDTHTGNQRWVEAIGAQTEWPVAVDDHGIVVATPTQLIMLSHDGTQQQRRDVEVTAPPLLIADGVFVVTESAAILSDRTGNTLTTWSLHDAVVRHDSQLQSLSISSQPRYDAHAIYMADLNGRMLCICDLHDEKTLITHWYQNTSSAPFSGQSVVQSTLDPAGNLVVASNAQIVTVLAHDSGDVITQVHGDANVPPSAIASSANTIVVADRMHLTAYDRAQNSPIWQIPVQATSAQQLQISGTYVAHLYQTNATQAIISVVDISTGKVLWSLPYFTKPNQQQMDVDTESVYIDGMFRLNVADGTLQWFSELPLQHQVRTATAWCGIVSIKTSTFACIDASTGKGIPSSIQALPVGAQLYASQDSDTIVVASALHVWVYDSRSGLLKWDVATTSAIQSVRVTADAVYVAMHDGRVVMHDSATGKVIAHLRDAPFNYETNSSITRQTSFYVNQDTIFLVSNLHILALKIPEHNGVTP